MTGGLGGGGQEDNRGLEASFRSLYRALCHYKNLMKDARRPLPRIQAPTAQCPSVRVGVMEP